MYTSFITHKYNEYYIFKTQYSYLYSDKETSKYFVM